MTTIILDDASFHNPLRQSENPKNLTTSKGPRNKRKVNQSKSSEKPLYHLPVVDDNSTEHSMSLLTNNEPEAKRRKRIKIMIQGANTTLQHRLQRILKNLAQIRQIQLNTGGHPEYPE